MSDVSRADVVRTWCGQVQTASKSLILKESADAGADVVRTCY